MGDDLLWFSLGPRLRAAAAAVARQDSGPSLLLAWTFNVLQLQPPKP